MAGGLATRLGHLTRDRPKSLVKVQGKPFLAYQLELLRRAGVEDVVVCIGHLSKHIENYFGDGRRHGVSIRYSFEDTPLGTAGALKNAGTLLNDTFFCMYGDSYLFVDFLSVMRYFQSRNKLALMTVYRNYDRFGKSNAAVEGNLVTRYDKQAKTGDMVYVDYGANIFRKQALEMIPEGQSYSLDALFSRLIAVEELLAFELKERFYEIGSPQGLKDFKEYVKGAAGDTL